MHVVVQKMLLCNDRLLGDPVFSRKRKPPPAFVAGSSQNANRRKKGTSSSGPSSADTNAIAHPHTTNNSEPTVQVYAVAIVCNVTPMFIKTSFKFPLTDAAQLSA